MSTSPPRFRLPLLLFAGGILLSAIVVATTMKPDSGPQVQVAEAAAQPGPAFDEWTRQDPSVEEGRGKFLGHVERNGEIIEVREAAGEDVVEEIDDSGPEPESPDNELR